MRASSCQIEFGTYYFRPSATKPESQRLLMRDRPDTAD